jgi:hypothetical protein
MTTRFLAIVFLGRSVQGYRAANVGSAAPSSFTVVPVYG